MLKDVFDVDNELPSWAYSRALHKYPIIRRIFLHSIIIKKLLHTTDEEKNLIEFISHTMNCSKLRARWIYSSSIANEANNIIDQAILNTYSTSTIQKIYAKNVRLERKDEEKIEGGKIYLLNSFSLHYFGLLSTPKINVINIVQPIKAIKYLNQYKFYQKMEAVSGKKINLIASDESHSMLKILKRLKKGESVFMRIDSLPTETNAYIMTKIFGVNAVFPASIIKLAAMTNSLLVPMFTYRIKGKLVTETCKGIKCKSDIPYELISTAQSIENNTEIKIRQLCSSYSCWHGLKNRVDIGTAINKKTI